MTPLLLLLIESSSSSCHTCLYSAPSIHHLSALDYDIPHRFLRMEQPLNLTTSAFSSPHFLALQFSAWCRSSCPFRYHVLLPSAVGAISNSGAERSDIDMLSHSVSLLFASLIQSTNQVLSPSLSNIIDHQRGRTQKNGKMEELVRS